MSEDGASQASERAGSPAQTAAAAGVTHADACTAVSQTNIPQMTTSSVPQTEGNKWSCEVCTYENFPLSRKCTMCRSPRPTVDEDIFKLQADVASALPVSTAHIDSGAEAVTERLKPLRISSPHGQSSNSSYVKWPCPTCTYENWPKSTKCAMCGAACPGAEAGAAPPSNTIINTSVHKEKPKEKASLQDLRQEKDNMTQRVRTNVDLLWLQACLGVVEGCQRSVDAYLAAGGDPARVLTEQEVALLNRASAFDAGHTLVHLAIRFHRQDILSSLLARISGSGPGLKRSPSYRAPELAAAIRRHMAGCVRHKKGSFPGTYLNEFCTFSLPAEISELPGAIQEQLFDELLDHDAQTQLEQDGAINSSPIWSRLLALWNRSAGDCLPDAIAQACYGVFDRHNVLRRALADTLSLCSRAFHERWLAREIRDAHALRYQPADAALRADWARLRQAASTPHAPLHQRWLAREIRDAHALRYQPADAALRADWARLRQAASTPHAPLHQTREPLLTHHVSLVALSLLFHTLCMETEETGERWLAREIRDAHALRYQPADAALRADWARLRQAASTPHAPLHQV
ncbi:zn-finger in ran binding protein and others domain-containing protein [Phthorimaea operculella]|nr:zn-finger in ran binding protein and others domain-containing protein [Phthorimaea operculella]